MKPSEGRLEGSASLSRGAPGVVDVLVASLRALAAAGRTDEACRLAGRACAAVRGSDPTAWRQFNALLHRLTREGTSPIDQ